MSTGKYKNSETIRFIGKLVLGDGYAGANICNQLRTGVKYFETKILGTLLWVSQCAG